MFIFRLKKVGLIFPTPAYKKLTLFFMHACVYINSTRQTLIFEMVIKDGEGGGEDIFFLLSPAGHELKFKPN